MLLSQRQTKVLAALSQEYGALRLETSPDDARWPGVVLARLARDEDAQTTGWHGAVALWPDGVIGGFRRGPDQQVDQDTTRRLRARAVIALGDDAPAIGATLREHVDVEVGER